MTGFWIVAALLIVAALAFVLPPLLRRGAAQASAAQPGKALNVAVYRDQMQELEADRRAGTLSDAQYEQARVELERRLLDDVAAETAPAAAARPAGRVTAIVVGVAVPLIAVSLYFVLGTPRALSPVALPTDAQHVTPQQIEAMVAKLAQRMKQNPDDPQGWAMLAKSYAVMGRYEDAVTAYAKAAERVPNDASLLADYADALAMARGQSLEGEPEVLIRRALQADPNHVKALALAGTVAFDKKDYTGALKHWEKAATLVPADTDIGRNIASSIAEARSLAGSGAAPAKVAADKPVAAAAGGGVSGKVTLAPALAAKAAPGDTVFIFARAAEGPRMPLAILRKKVSDLPLSFTLDDSLAMSPAARLSGTPQVIVGARISKSGDAMPRPGDLQGSTKAVSNTQKDLAIVIDNEVP